jgi:hypothetical protein
MEALVHRLQTLTDALEEKNIPAVQDSQDSKDSKQKESRS